MPDGNPQSSNAHYQAGNPMSLDTSSRNPDDFVLPDDAKLQALAEFAAGAGHEINNPLATIIGRAQLLLKGEQDPQRRQMLMAIGAQAYRIRDMIGDAMLFGRPPVPEVSSVDLESALRNITAKHADEFARHHCSVTINSTPGLILLADPVQLDIVLNELLRNSQQALLARNGGTITVRTFFPEADEFSKLGVFEIEDHGQGFTEIERRHAFDPFFSGRQAGRGLGFGLCKCWRIVRQHGGRIEIESSPQLGTIARVFWPLAT